MENKKPIVLTAFCIIAYLLLCVSTSRAQVFYFENNSVKNIVFKVEYLYHKEFSITYDQYKIGIFDSLYDKETKTLISSQNNIYYLVVAPKTKIEFNTQFLRDSKIIRLKDTNNEILNEYNYAEYIKANIETNEQPYPPILSRQTFTYEYN